MMLWFLLSYGCLGPSLSLLKTMANYWVNIRSHQYQIVYQREVWVNNRLAENATYTIIDDNNNSLVKMETEFGWVITNTTHTCVTYEGTTACGKGDPFHLSSLLDSDPKKDLYVVEYMAKKKCLTINKQNATFINYTLDYGCLSLADLYKLNKSRILNTAKQFTILRWWNGTTETRRELLFTNAGDKYDFVYEYLYVGKIKTNLSWIFNSTPDYPEMVSLFKGLQAEWYQYAKAHYDIGLFNLAMEHNILSACPDDSCRLSVMLKYDRMECGRLANPDECYMEFAIKHNDTSLCFKIQNKTMLAECRRRIS